MKKVLSIVLLSFLFVGMTKCFAEEEPITFTLTPKEQVIKQILEEGYDYSARGLFEAIKDGNSQYVSKFLMTGTSPNTTYMKVPALFWAINRKQPKIVEQLIKAGADPNLTSTGFTPLCAAIKSKNDETVSTLIRLGANVNQLSEGITPINYAIKQKNENAVKKLINAGAIVDEKALLSALKTKNENTKNMVLLKYKKQ